MRSLQQRAIQQAIRQTLLIPQSVRRHISESPRTVTETSSNELSQAISMVESMLGRCLLRVQCYEHMAKKLLIGAHVTILPGDTEHTLHARAQAEMHRQTLGMIVGRLTKTFICSHDETDAHHPSLLNEPPSLGAEFRASLSLGAADRDELLARLREFVNVRNQITHHFLEFQQLNTLEGCERALQYLKEAQERIDACLNELQYWLKALVTAIELRERAQSDPVIVNVQEHGIMPDNTILWPIAGIVRALEQAADSHAIDGWTALSDATTWIAQNAPEQQPAKYGCKSWPQVVHMSKVLELQYRTHQGKRKAFYRPKPGDRDAYGVVVQLPLTEDDIQRLGLPEMPKQ